jgi:hypothetical protein
MRSSTSASVAELLLPDVQDLVARQAVERSQRDEFLVALATECEVIVRPG